ncbi:MAG: Holliday junction branch migration protein RuvA [Brevinematia bacterium]
MFEYFVGKVTEVEENRIVVEVNNIGYSILLPLRDVNLLEVNREYKIYVHKHVYEDGEELYGFIDRDSKKLFLVLTGVSNVGPRIALRILSYLSPSEIVRAVTTNKPEVISAIKGVGDKVAERIVAELKNTIHRLGIKVEGEESNFDDLVKALRSLGYNQNEILFAINTVRKQNPNLLYLDLSSALHLCLSALKSSSK